MCSKYPAAILWSIFFAVLATSLRSAGAYAGNDDIIVDCAGATYRVPRAYLTGAHEAENDADVTTLNFLLALPGLRPRSAATAPILDSLTSIDKLRATFTCAHNSKMTPSSQRIQEIVENSGLKQDQYSIVGNELRLYRDKIPGPAAELYVALNYRSSPTLFMQCPSDGFAPFPACTVIERLDEHVEHGFYVGYYLDKRYCLQIQNIDKQLRDLLSSFRTR